MQMVYIYGSRFFFYKSSYAITNLLALELDEYLTVPVLQVVNNFNGTNPFRKFIMFAGTKVDEHQRHEANKWSVFSTCTKHACHSLNPSFFLLN
jgi:hypothetical protein